MVRNIESDFREYTVRGKVIKYKELSSLSNSTDAYFIGYISADGTYQQGMKPNGKSYPTMGISSTDEYIVRMFRNLYCPLVQYKNRGKRSSKKVKANNNSFELKFPRGMKDTFNKFGVFDYKPSRKMVGVSKSMQWAYMLGIMDADGCFVVRHRRDCRTPRLNIHIVSCAYNVLVEMQRRLEEQGIISSVYQRKSSNCFELRINNTEHAIRFGKLLYRDLPSVYNYKKKHIFDTYVNTYTSSSCSNSDELTGSPIVG